ncbi:MAG: protein kinase [Anaerolineae bacterium]|nr:protein kinase [Anaerolineae bacterium]
MELVKSIKGYELHERIGSGGFGVVHRATQTTVGREVAIKIVLPHFANHPDFIRRFETEAQLIARLEHPFIVPLYDYWRDPEGAFLVMRLMRGGNLRDALANNGPYELEAAALLLDQITSALSMAHRNEIVHRDLKPANVLLDEDGNAYLSDFGIAKDVARTEDKLTATGVMLGSPDYLSPEQARSEPVRPQTDIYSLGVVLYEVLTGHHPFPDVSSVERIYKHLNEPLPLIDFLPLDVTDDINAIIQKATAKNPAMRYGDVLEMVVDYRRGADLSKRSPESILEQLTLREQQILQMITDGCSNKEIAEQLFITVGTVKWHIRQVYQKLHVRSRVQAILRARELNLIVSDTTDEYSPGEATIVAWPEPENPYKGLRAFQTADARDFFGREKLVQRLVQRLGDHDTPSRFLAVIGPSGSGKSSVVKAGLVPALRRGDLPGAERWFIVEMIPGVHPLDELEIALTRVAANQSGNLRQQLERDARGLVRVGGLILPDDGSELLVIVDQFEEVFTLVENEARRVQFLDLLEAAATDPRNRVRVVITLRADFYDRPLHYPQFGDLVCTQMETVMPLSADELEAAVTRPAARVGVSFEPGLVTIITSDVHYQPGALPLLQYALTELFEKRTDHTLTVEAYQALGGAAGALTRRAEELYHEQDAGGQEILRQMFLRLVSLGEGVEDTRRRVPRSELLSIAADDERMDEALDTFAAYRLLTLDHDPATRRPTVEIAHEAILHEWQRLRAWLDENRHEIHQQRLLAAAAIDWQNAGRDPSYLLHGARLEQYAPWSAMPPLALTPEEREFLETSIAAQCAHEESERERQAHELALAKQAAEAAQRAAASARQAEASQRQSATRLRYLVAVLGIFLATAGVLSVFAFGKEHEANVSRSRAEREASVNHSLVLAAYAREEAEVGRDDLALLLALEANSIDQPPIDAENTLADVAFAAGTRQVLEGHYGEVRAIAFSPDGRMLLSAGCAQPGTEAQECARSELILWDIAAGIELRRWQGAPGWINALAFDPTSNQDENLIAASAFADGTLIVWDIATGQTIYRLEGHASAVNDVVFVPGQRAILSASDDGTAILWDAESGAVLRRLEGHTAAVNTVSVNSDGTRAATASADGLVIEWDINPDSPTFGAAIQQFAEHGSEVIAAAFVSDSSAILSNGVDLSFRLWDAQTGEEIRQRVIGAWGIPMTVSPDGHTVLFPIGEFVYLWDTEVWWQDQSLAGHIGTIRDAAFSPDGRLAATAASDGTIRIWNIHAQGETHRYAEGIPVFAVEASPDGSRIMIGEVAPGGLLVIDTRTTELLHRILTEGHSTAPGAIAIDPDGRYALVGALDLENYTQGTRLTLWDLDSGDVVRDFPAEVYPWRSVAFGPDGRLALAGTQDFSDQDLGGELFLLDIETGQMVRRFDTTHDITSIAFNQDGTRAISGSCYFLDAAFWDVETGQAIRTFPGQPGCTLDVSFGPDETTIITATNDGSITEWDIETGAKIRQFVGHNGPVWSLDFARDNRTMASGSSDGSVILWDYATGDILRRLEGHLGWVFDVDFSADDELLYSASADGTVREWRVSDWELEDLLGWVHENRYIRDFTCDERAQYRIEPLCDGSN